MTYLSNRPNNLKIATNAAVCRVLLDGKRAIGVETVNGRKHYARKEVMLSAGALNTPQILLLSGIGPRDELKKHDIKMLHDLPQLAKNLQDHCFSPVGIVMRDDGRISDEKQSPTPMGWFKLGFVLASEEYETLSQPMKDFLNAPTVPRIVR